MKIRNYKELIVWQKSMLLAKKIYLLTKNFPPEEKYGLSSQMQRCAISIPSNIAEGAKRHYKLEYIHMLSNASGSAGELETQILLADDIYSHLQIKSEIAEVLHLTDEVLKMLFTLISTLKKS